MSLQQDFDGCLDMELQMMPMKSGIEKKKKKPKEQGVTIAKGRDSVQLLSCV